MYISEQDKETILSRSEGRLIEIIGNFTHLRQSGASYLGKCPLCGEERGLNISPGKSVFKCFKCNELSGKRPIDYLMKGERMTFPEALKYLAGELGIFIEEQPAKPKTPVSKKTNKTGKLGVKKGSYCAQMLESSGLTVADITAKVYKTDDVKTVFSARTFKPGTINDHGEIIAGDDVIIEYYDLEGKPFLYEQKDKKGVGTGRYREYYRVRWQYPEEHKDKNGKSVKYKSPYGSPTFIYIPEKIREAYKKKEPIAHLFIQEGEKKAEKACKHGMYSIAVSGIQNLGFNKQLPEELIKLIAQCEVKNVTFLLDSDCFDLSKDLRITDNVAYRPNLFFSAVRNYKDYMRALSNRNIYVEIYFGYVLQNNASDKGIDDLLTNTLKGNEDALKSDFDHLINEKDLSGKYLKLHKITTVTDQKIKEIWRLDNPKSFAEQHFETLKDMPEFTFGRQRWRFVDGELVSAQPVESDEKFWDEIEKKDRQGNIIGKTVEFKYVRSHNFLQNRGFGRFKKMDGTFEYIHLTPPTVRTVQHWEIRDFLYEFARMNCNEDVNELLIRGGVQYLGPDKLSSIQFIEPAFPKYNGSVQHFYFENSVWEVTKSKIQQIDYAAMSNHHFWYDKKKQFPAQLIQQPLMRFWKEETGYNYTLSETGKQCHFLQFLINASNFTWKKERMIANGDTSVSITPEDVQENNTHLLSKLCAFGYLLLDFKDPNTAKAVVGMDGKQSEVGESNGRSGKSLFGEAMRQIKSSAYINGKKSDIETDTFIWNDIIEKTQFVFIDDVRPRFNFESQFANITGDWAVNYKGGGRATFPFSMSPKEYISTNHALNGDGSSFKARQWLLAFSDFYNDTHQPKDDFGLLFFTEWEFEQWNLFYNLCALCVQLYLTFGVVEAPGERLAQRIIRQKMGENFLAWAEEYYSAGENTKLNARIPRKEIYDKYLQEFPNERKFTSSQKFKDKLHAYCTWKGYTFNPQRYDSVTGLPLYFDKDGNSNIDDKSGGVEYFTIGTADFNKKPAEFDFNQQVF
jgi:hypothetical protein